MANLSARQLERMISAERPGYDVVSVKSATQAEPEADALVEPADRTPDLEELRREFLGDGAEDLDVEGGMAVADAVVAAPARRRSDHADDEVKVLRLHPKSSERDAFDRGPGAKTIVVSNRDGKVLAEQG